MKAFGGIWLDRAGEATLQDQIASQIRDQVQRGMLRPHEMLPSTRDLAAHLHVSRNTVVYAYDRLISEGYMESRPRSGFFVCALGALPRKTQERAPARRRSSLDAESSLASTIIRSPRPFRPCQPDVGLFPLLMWNRLRGRVLRQIGKDLLHYPASGIAGFPALRRNLAQYLRVSRGVRSHRNGRRMGASQSQAEPPETNPIRRTLAPERAAG